MSPCRRLAGLGIAAPLAWLGAVAAPVLGVAGLAALAMDGAAAVRVAGTTAGLGALLGIALAWSSPTSREGQRRAVVAVLLVAGGAAAAAVVPVGAVAYLATPCWLIWLARRGAIASLGLGTETSTAAVVAGLAVGGTLAAHLLLSAQLTSGYRPLEAGIAPVALALAYDAGVQVIVTEVFFRGALFNRLQRHASFIAACALATAMTMVRYLVDPQLPSAVELQAGAAFYTGLLSIGNCWLLWRFGTLVPCLGASFVFFAAYRVLTAR